MSRFRDNENREKCPYPSAGNYSIKAFSIKEAFKNAARIHPGLYGEFRKQWMSLRSKGLMPTGSGLVGTRVNYSERREAYVKELQNMMERNNLPSLDRADIHGGETVYIRPAEGSS